MKTSDVISNVRRLHWGTGRDNTFMGSLEGLLESTGYNINYDDLMGISGQCFRFQIHEDWCPSSSDATCGYNCAKNVLDKLNIVYETINIANKNATEIAKIRTKVIKSIDNKIPVIASNLKIAPDFGLITGYEDNGKEYLCRTYYDETKDYSYIKKDPDMIYILEDFSNMPNIKPLVSKSLDYIRIINDSQNKEGYFCGICGFEYWIFDLEDEEKFDSYEAHKKLQHPNAWIYYSLLDSRMSALRYLKKYKEIFVIEEINKLISLYEEVVSILKKAETYVKFPYELDYKDWTFEYRRKQAKALREILLIEEKIYEQVI